MSLEDIAFVLGPLGAVLLVPAALVVLAVRRRPRWSLWLGTALAIAAANCWVGYWVLWGRAFDHADALRPVPASLDSALSLTMAGAAAGSVALTVTAMVALVPSRRAS